MLANVKAAGAGSIGLTLYPPYPDWAFENEGMYPYGYQNGGDWTWFGGRMVQELVMGPKANKDWGVDTLPPNPRYREDRNKGIL